ncbi:MAG: YebC/PmpR family DNA-binding transcriptional regulator [Anaerolineae bacterium]|nr:YebC/PmpR family DNA-binding transcriptional regulator [Anaerolineae bacterium]
MSGHSKWSTIKRKKGANDAKRGKLFTRLGREIMIAARNSTDPDANFALRLAVERARQANMPKDNIERAIKRGSGEDKEAAAFVEILYEAYAPHGIALLVEVTTDNRNRSLSELKHVLTRNGGSMAEVGSVSWQFIQKGYITVPAGQRSYDEIFMMAADAGAEDVLDDPETIEIFTPREDLQAVEEALRSTGLEIEEARLDWVPKTPIDLGSDEAHKVMNVIEQIEDLEDTQSVYSNLNMTAELVESFEVMAG